MRLYRLTRQRDSVRAFDGTSAAAHPGRWNLRGRAAVYAASSISLAVLEVLVQSMDPGAADLMFYRIDIDDWMLERFAAADLPEGWRTMAGRDDCRRIGEGWRAGCVSIGLIVPSAVLPEAYEDGEVNVVLNPQHPAFVSIVVDGPVRVNLDERLSR